MKISCPNCGQHYEVDVSQQGQRVTCQVCGSSFAIGAAAGTASFPNVPPPPPEVNSNGFSGLKVFVSCMLVLTVLLLGAMGGGFYFLIRQHNMERARLEQELKRVTDELERSRMSAQRKEEEARRQEEERRRGEEQRELERRQAEKRKEEEARRQAEAERLERKKREAAESRRAELDARSAALQEKLDKLKSELSELREREEDSQIAQTARELERLDEMAGSKKYQCFDFCVLFQKIEFKRVMRTRTVRPNQNGYFTALYDLSPKYGHKYEKVDVSYTCDRHQQTWTQRTADEYRSGYLPKRQLETQRSRLRNTLDRLRKAAAVKRQAEENALKSEIAKVSAELAALRKSAGD